MLPATEGVVAGNLQFPAPEGSHPGKPGR
jgi:hypothetical protein